MKISLNLLRHYVTLPETANELDDLLVSVGLEVESMDVIHHDFKDIIIAEVKHVQKHPNANNLQLCHVYDGKRSYEIVCGAKNVAVGQKIALAKIGTYLQAINLIINRRQIRGIESVGMICSEAELGISKDHSGILVLQNEAVIGETLETLFDTNDVIFEIGITPNRGDALSYIGIARDIAAVTGNALRYPKLNIQMEKKADFAIEVLAIESCLRYSAALVTGITNISSPLWLKQALYKSGIRPLNLIVDVTNFVMIEIGQPMHAFDHSTIEGKKIIVRNSKKGEEFVTLDENTHRLPEHSLLICDESKPVALAGIMGGLNSEIGSHTTDVLLESACFSPASIRQTLKHIGIGSESSYRFERGTDSNRTLWALQRATDLLIEFGGARFDGYADSNPGKVMPALIDLRPEKTSNVLGYTVDPPRQKAILEALEIMVRDSGDTLFHCTIPTFRTDITREIDLIEEIARINGYDKIPVPKKYEVAAGEYYNSLAFVSKLHDIVIGIGFDEILTSTLVPDSFNEFQKSKQSIKVLNPVSTERPALRSSLLPSMLEVVDRNARNSIKSMRLFEIGTVFHGALDESHFQTEETMIGLCMYGHAHEKNWFEKERELDVYDIKGAIVSLFRKLRIDNAISFSYDTSDGSGQGSVLIQIQGTTIGHLYEFQGEITRNYQMEHSVFAVEFFVDRLNEFSGKTRIFNDIPKYPAVNRDLAFLISCDISADKFLQTVQHAPCLFLKDVRIVDVFTHERFTPGSKSIAVALKFLSVEKTLTDEEVSTDMQNIIRTITSELSAELRN